MLSFGQIESHPKLLFNRMTMAAVSALNAETSSARIIAARFRVLWTRFQIRQASA